MCPDRQGGDDTVGTTTPTGESPVQVGVLGGRGSEELTLRRNNLKGKRLVGSKTKFSGQDSVTATLGETTSQTDSGTFSRNNSKALLVRSFDELRTNDTGTDSDCGTVIVLVRPLPESDVLETLGPDSERTCTSRTS